LVTIPTCSSGYIGSKFGLNFPVVSRASFGMRGAWIAMVIRGVVCVIWMGVQSSVGGNAVRCMVEVCAVLSNCLLTYAPKKILIAFAGNMAKLQDLARQRTSTKCINNR
jgi:cytosine/uracil/thiamine/allantoin permease